MNITYEKHQKGGEDIDISHQNRHILRPIEVKDYRKNNLNGTNSNFYQNQQNNNSQNKHQQNLHQNSNSNFYPSKNNITNSKNQQVAFNNNNNLSVVKPKNQKNVLKNNHSHKSLFNYTKEGINFDEEFSDPKNHNFQQNNNLNIVNSQTNNIFDDLNTNLDFYKELLKREKMQVNNNPNPNQNSKYQKNKNPNLKEIIKNINLNSTTLDQNSQSPDEEKRLSDKFSKTSNNFEFKILENLDIMNLNTDISVLEENFKMNKGDLVKKLKSIYDNLNISQNFKNTGNINKSIYQNTSMFEKNNNITRIETIFEDYEVKEDEMIHLSTTKSSRKLGNLRKMLHGGTCKIYVVRVSFFFLNF
jgi:hypothetical protein